MIPALHDVGALRHVLPYGRYLTTFDEIEERFVPNDDQNRVEIWNSFLESVEIAKQAFGSVIGVWIGGSFITSEQQPHDIDVVFLIREEAYGYAEENNERKFFARLLLNGSIDKVDSYLVGVAPTDTSNPESRYLNLRGYWDQFWSKARYANTNNEQRWLYPSAGYLQVVIDGYDD